MLEKCAFLSQTINHSCGSGLGTGYKIWSLKYVAIKISFNVYDKIIKSINNC